MTLLWERLLPPCWGLRAFQNLDEQFMQAGSQQHICSSQTKMDPQNVYRPRTEQSVLILAMVCWGRGYAGVAARSNKEMLHNV